MKLLFKHTFRLVVFACVSAFFSGCEQDPKYKVYDYPMPVVESIYPTDGYVTTQVVITGTNFGDRTEAVKVFFGEVQSSNVLDCKNNRLVVEVPETAVTGNLSLQIYNKKVEDIGHYTVLPTPRVITVTSESEDGENVADTGDKVTITGENFGSDPSDISVSFNGTPAEFELIDESTIIAITPADYKTGNVIVTIHGYAMTGSAMFNPNSKGDVTVLYLKNFKQPFTKANDENWKNGEWWTPAVWNQNAASFNAEGSTTVSGMQYKAAEGYTLAFQNGWNKNAYANGKMWQATTLRPGKYRLEVTYAYSLVVNDPGNFISVLIAKGSSENDIPDVADIEQLDGVYAVYDKMGTANDSGVLVTPSFEVAQATDVVIGFLTSMAKNNSYFKVTELKLILE